MRVHDWDIRLADYVKAQRHVSFAWGKNDCLAFANGAVKAQTGTGFCDDIAGSYRGAAEARRAVQKWDFLAEMDKRLVRASTRFPARGAIVARPLGSARIVLPFALGVAVSHVIAFLGGDGLLMVPPESGDIVWNVT